MISKTDSSLRQFLTGTQRKGGWVQAGRMVQKDEFVHLIP